MLLACLLAVAVHAGLPDAEWRRGRAEALELMRKKGSLEHKEALIRRLAPDDSERLARLLVRWAAAAREQRVHTALGDAIAGLKDHAAIRALVDAKKMEPGPVRMGLLRCLLEELRADFLEATLRFAEDEDLPRGRLMLLHWIMERDLKQGLDACVACLDARETLVRRTAVAALWKLNRPRCVGPLIEALPSAGGQLLDEMEQALRFFTGKSFDGVAAAWQAWWKSEGAAYLESRSRARHRPKQKDEKKPHTTAFYDLPTRSERIVFVLDRSGSMKSPTHVRGHVPGRTWFEVMQNQFARALRSLPRRAQFGIVFYGSDISVWKEPPALVEATPQNRELAEGWVRAVKPRGSTRLFEALLKALEYAESLSGANTIYLLSDGSPDHGEGRLTDWEVNEEYRKFKAENKLYRCVVHCIGIGPQHNRDLMARIARESGGRYKMVAR